MQHETELVMIFFSAYNYDWHYCALLGLLLLSPQSGALRISAYRDFQSNPIQSTYNFRAFKPFYGDQKQCKWTTGQRQINVD